MAKAREGEEMAEKARKMAEEAERKKQEAERLQREVSMRIVSFFLLIDNLF